MIPWLALTSTIIPSFKILVAFLVAMMAGMFNSRETMAAWQVTPPSSVMMAAAFFRAGMNSGRA